MNYKTTTIGLYVKNLIKGYSKSLLGYKDNFTNYTLYTLILTILMFIDISNFPSWNILLYDQSIDFNLYSYMAFEERLISGNDSGNHFFLANALANSGALPPGSSFLVGAAPGLTLLESLLIKIFTLKFFPLSFILLTCLLWSQVFLIWFYKSNSGYLNLILIPFVYFVTNYFSPFSTWMFYNGFFFTETLATAFFLIFVKTFSVLILSDNKSTSYFYGSISGIFLSLSIYMRATYSLIIYLLFGFLLILLLFKNWKFMKKYFTGLLSICLLLIITLYPWMRYSKENYGIQYGKFIRSEEQFRLAWIPDSQAAGFSLTGTGWACRIAPNKCVDIYIPQTTNVTYRNEAFKVVLNNPLDYLKDRLYFFYKAWFSSEINGHVGSLDRKIQGLILTLMTIVLIVFSFSRNVRHKTIAILTLTLTSALLVPYATVHMEVRFFIPIKVLIFFAFIKLMSSNFSLLQKRSNYF